MRGAACGLLMRGNLLATARSAGVPSAYDYAGNSLPVHAVGATPGLADIDPDNWNLDPERLAAAFGPATRAVIVSHLHGGLVPMAALTDEARRRGVRVVEDAAQ